MGLSAAVVPMGRWCGDVGWVSPRNVVNHADLAKSRFVALESHRQSRNPKYPPQTSEQVSGMAGGKQPLVVVVESRWNRHR